MQVVRNALAAIESLAGSDKPLGVSELGRLIGLPPSSTHRLLATLVEAGYAMPVPGAGRYQAGPSLLRLRAGGTLPLLRDAAHPVLMKLAEATQETAHLATLDGTEVIALDQVAIATQNVARHPVGSRMPIHATALGLVLLAFRPDVVDAVVDLGLPRLSDRTIDDPIALRRYLGEVKQRGYATNVGGWHLDAVGVAAPVITRSGQTVAAVGVSGAAARLNRSAVLTALGTLLARAGREIGERLGTPTPTHPALL
jgi:DNA-binding IclR family transcriptional regulator